MINGECWYIDKILGDVVFSGPCTKVSRLLFRIELFGAFSHIKIQEKYPIYSAIFNMADKEIDGFTLPSCISKCWRLRRALRGSKISLEDTKSQDTQGLIKLIECQSTGYNTCADLLAALTKW